MKIHILPVKPEFQPDRQNFVSSALQEFGVEQDLSWWLRERADLLTDGGADWHYLPVWWNRYYINRDWGQDGLDELQAEILRLVNRSQKTFTVCEYDILAMQPFLDLCGMTIFTASRQGEGGIDVPLLCKPNPFRAESQKRWLASFVGNLWTHSPRPEMYEALKGRGDCRVEHGDKGLRYFAELMAQSYVALCPRGHGGSSFRFCEAMEMGIVPLHIGRPDVRPFKEWVDWASCSLYRPDADGLDEYLGGLDRDRLLEMGAAAKVVYDEQLRFGKWGRYVIKTLEGL